MLGLDQLFWMQLKKTFASSWGGVKESVCGIKESSSNQERTSNLKPYEGERVVAQAGGGGVFSGSEAVGQEVKPQDCPRLWETSFKGEGAKQASKPKFQTQRYNLGGCKITHQPKDGI